MDVSFRAFENRYPRCYVLRPSTRMYIYVYIYTIHVYIYKNIYIYMCVYLFFFSNTTILLNAQRFTNRQTSDHVTATALLRYCFFFFLFFFFFQPPPIVKYCRVIMLLTIGYKR